MAKRKRKRKKRGTQQPRRQSVLPRKRFEVQQKLLLEKRHYSCGPAQGGQSRGLPRDGTIQPYWSLTTERLGDLESCICVYMCVNMSVCEWISLRSGRTN